MELPPAKPPAKPNQTHQALVATSTVFLVVSSVAVISRLLVRKRQLKAVTAFDDILQPIILLIFIGLCITAYVGVGLNVVGYGDRIASAAQDGAGSMHHAKVILAAGALFVLATGLTKISALWLYRRTFCVHSGSVLQVIIWTLITVVSLWTLTFFVFHFAQCGTNLDALWSGVEELSVTYCGPAIDMDRAVVISNFILDTLILIVPLPPIFGLRVSLGRRFGIATVFAFAFLSYAIVIFQLVSQTQVYDAVDNGKIIDGAFENSGILWARILEVGTAIIAVNLPPLYPLVKPIKAMGGMTTIKTLFRSADSSQERIDPPEKAVHVSNDYGVSTEPAANNKSMV